MTSFALSDIFPQASLEDADAAMDCICLPPPLSQVDRAPGIRRSFKASSRWHLFGRLRTRKPLFRSVIEVLNDPPPALAEVMNTPGLTSVQLRNAVKSRAYLPAQFNPMVASALYSYFLPAGGAVLDPCAGWGDRLAAALANPTVGTYLGVDANSGNFPGYQSQIARYGDQSRHQVIHGAFEDLHIPHNSFDLVFTSPPYVRAEIYSADPEQSHYRYSDYRDWVVGFLEPLIVNSHASLRYGGCLVLNIGIGQYDTGKRVCDLPAECARITESLGMHKVMDSVYRLVGKTEPLLAWRKL